MLKPRTRVLPSGCRCTPSCSSKVDNACAFAYCGTHFIPPARLGPHPEVAGAASTMQYISRVAAGRVAALKVLALCAVFSKMRSGQLSSSLSRRKAGTHLKFGDGGEVSIA
uniref:Uncharacterized protein n=1 Tax=Schistocephalus solidus TaxID=70667 RepID=A0A0X3PM83_SCHSO